MNTKTLLLDVGGTFIKCSDGRSIPISSGGSRAEIAASLQEAVAPLKGSDASSLSDAAVGVCIPGPFDYRQGVFLMKHKFASVYGESFRSLAGLSDSVRMGFVHDVNAPLLGLLSERPELRRGRVALVTLGTGLGFSYAVDGIVQMSESLGPVRSLYDRPFRESILEDYVPRRAILKAYGKPIEGDVKEISERARSGEKTAMDAFLSAGKAFSEGVRPLLEELQIKTIFFGGQIARSFDLMEPAVRQGLPGVSLEVIADYSRTAMLGAATVLE